MIGPQLRQLFSVGLLSCAESDDYRNFMSNSGPLGPLSSYLPLFSTFSLILCWRLGPKISEGSMRVGRAKACVNCRIAKARCSLSAPCSRCAKRCLECHYAPAQPRRLEHRWTDGFRPISSAAGTCSANVTTRGGDPQRHRNVTVVDDAASFVTPAPAAEAPSSSAGVAFGGAETFASTAAGRGTPMPDVTVPSDFTRQPFDMSGSSDLSLAADPASYTTHARDSISDYPSFSHIPSSPRLPDLDFSLANPGSHDQILAEVPCRIGTFDTPGLLTTPNTMNCVSRTNALGPHLSQRARSIQQGSLTAKLLFSRLTDFTRMMADGKLLPPFLHPPCSCGCGYECPPESPHMCLPESLAVCANLTRMFYSRMPGSHGFVWQQICAHLRQMRVEVRFWLESALAKVPTRLRLPSV